MFPNLSRTDLRIVAKGRLFHNPQCSKIGAFQTFWLLFDDPHDEIPHNEDEIVEDEKTRKLEEENQRLKRERDQLAAREAEVERKYRRLLIKVPIFYSDNENCLIIIVTNNTK